MLGNGRLEAMCFDGTKRLCHIRGKLRKKVGSSRPSPHTFLSTASTHRKPPDVELSRRILGVTQPLWMWPFGLSWPRVQVKQFSVTLPNFCCVLFSFRFGLTHQTSSWSDWEITRCVYRSPVPGWTNSRKTRQQFTVCRVKTSRIKSTI